MASFNQFRTPTLPGCRDGKKADTVLGETPRANPQLGASLSQDSRSSIRRQLSQYLSCVSCWPVTRLATLAVARSLLRGLSLPGAAPPPTSQKRAHARSVRLAVDSASGWIYSRLSGTPLGGMMRSLRNVSSCGHFGWQGAHCVRRGAPPPASRWRYRVISNLRAGVHNSCTHGLRGTSRRTSAALQ